MLDLEQMLFLLSSDKRVESEIYPRRVYQLLCQQGLNPNQIKFIHIAGSKGKGSLAHTSFDFLKSLQLRVGLFISPHILNVRERFVTQDGMITDQTLYQLIIKFQEFLQKEKLHFFEVCLFLAIVYFLEQKCEYVVLEVGVGGKFDPTNFCIPKIVLLGHITLEHTHLLGNSIEEIAVQKSGVIKPGILALSVDQEPCVEKILKSAGQIQMFSEFVHFSNINYTENHSVLFDLHLCNPYNFYIPQLHLNRMGKANMINFCLALAGLLAAKINVPEAVVRLVAQNSIPYRMDLVRENILIDTAHTVTSFDNLLESIRFHMKWKEIVLYIGLLEGKDIKNIAQVLISYHEIIHHVYVYDFSTGQKRQSDGQTLYQELTNFLPVSYMDDFSCIKIDYNKKTVFAGSFYSISSILSLI